MCDLSGPYEIDDTCGGSGSFRRLFVMTKTTWNAATKTLGTGATREQITAITGLPTSSVHEIEIDEDGATNSFEAAPSDGQVTNYTQTVTATRVGVGLTNNQLSADLQKCCKLVLVAQLRNAADEWIVIGVNKPPASSTVFSPNGIQAKTTHNTGAAIGDVPTTTYVFAQQSPKSDNAFLSLSTAAANAVIAALVP